jgi:adenylate cyclase
MAETDDTAPSPKADPRPSARTTSRRRRLWAPLRNTAYLGTTLPVVLALLIIGLWQPQPLADLRNLVFDAFQRQAPRIFDPSLPVRIIDIDEASLRELGQWPWPRTRIADLFDIATGQGAAAIGLDVVLSEADRLSPEAIIESLPPGPAREGLVPQLQGIEPHDRQLARRMAGAPVVLGVVLAPDGASHSLPRKLGVATAGDDPRPALPRFTGAVRPLDMLSETAKGLGALNWLPDDDQVVRRVPIVMALGDQIVPGFAAELLRVAQGASTIVVRGANASGHTAFGAASGVTAVKVGDFDIATGPMADVRVHFTPTDRRRFISAQDLLEGRVPAGTLDGHIVLIGTSAAGLRDTRATPIDAAVPGVEVHAQLIESVLTGDMLVRPDWALGLEIMLAFALALALVVIMPFGPALVGALIGFAAMAGLAATSWLAYRHGGLLLDAAFPILGIGLVQALGLVALYRGEQRQRAMVRQAFGRFVAPAVVDRLAENPAALTLGGEMRVLTVMFSDLRNFTSISEQYDAAGLTAFMNEYLTPMTDIVLDERGTVDKYIGDALMAFWNAPLDVPDHAARATRAALAMVTQLERLNEGWAAQAAREGRPHVRVTAGFGLATGPCSVGNMGSLRRFDYSALGDDVNLASRLEAATRHYGLASLAAEATRNAAADFAWLEVDRVRVKGKTRATTLYTLVGDERMAKDEEFLRLASTVTQIHKLRRAREFAAARAACTGVERIAPASLHGFVAHLIADLEKLMAKPPGPDWDGIRTFETK